MRKPPHGSADRSSLRLRLFRPRRCGSWVPAAGNAQRFRLGSRRAQLDCRSGRPAARIRDDPCARRHDPRIHEFASCGRTGVACRKHRRPHHRRKQPHLRDRERGARAMTGPSTTTIQSRRKASDARAAMPPVRRQRRSTPHASATNAQRCASPSRAGRFPGRTAMNPRLTAPARPTAIRVAAKTACPMRAPRGGEQGQTIQVASRLASKRVDVTQRTDQPSGALVGAA